MFFRTVKASVALWAILASVPAWPREKPDVWLEARSPHFRVATNGSDKQARRAAGQFERIRAAFQMVFPGQRVDPVAPIIVLAVKNEKSFNALTPREWQAKGALKRAGLFQRGEEKNYVLMRLDTVSENPYEVIYHEYTHLITSQVPEPLPLWLDEGLAEFYQTTQVQEKEVQLGRVSEGELQELRGSKLLPLETLFAVDHASPYYNENNKGSIFYAESWALVHMLMSESFGKPQNPLRDYFNLIAQKTDPQAAAHTVFGDLNQLFKRLQAYVGGSQFKYFYAKGATEVDEQAFTVREMTPAEADALRGDFLVYTHNYDLALPVLKQALEEDPKNAPACESMGLMQLFQNNRVEAGKWFTQATELDSKSYLAYYYSAVMRMQGSPQSSPGDEVGESLRKALAINPQFAPAMNALAEFYGMRGDNLEEAHTLAFRAVDLEPGNMYYYLTTANILMRMRQADNAVRVCQKALGLAKSPGELSAAQAVLANAQKFHEYLESLKRYNQREGTSGDSGSQIAGAASGGDKTGRPVLRHRGEETGRPSQAAETQDESARIQFQSDPVQRGSRDMLTGTIQDVQCSLPAVIKLTFVSGKMTVALFSDNYYAVEYSALNFAPAGELHPCQDIKGMKAKVFFYNLKDKPNEGELISVQLRK